MIAEHENPPLAFEEPRQFLTRHLSAFEVVRRDEADGFSTLQVGIDDQDRDAAPHRTFDRSPKRRIVQGCEDDAGNLLGHEVFDDLDLTLAVILLHRPLPNDLHPEFLSGSLGAGLDRLPKLVGRALRDDGDPVLRLRRRGRARSGRAGLSARVLGATAEHRDKKCRREDRNRTRFHGWRVVRRLALTLLPPVNRTRD